MSKQRKCKKTKSKNINKTTGWIEDNDILDVLTSPEDDDDALDLVQINEDEKDLVFFTRNYVGCLIHWCQEPELVGYIRCNGDDCVLCQIGNRKQKRRLISVYSIDSGKIEVLAISDSLRPHALLPQLGNILHAKGRRVAIISRHDRSKFRVATAILPKDLRSEVREKIKAFKDMLKEEELDFCSVYQTLKNSALREVPSIKRKLKLRDL